MHWCPHPNVSARPHRDISLSLVFILKIALVRCLKLTGASLQVKLQAEIGFMGGCIQTFRIAVQCVALEG